jgi:hypothetical protein
VEELADIAAKKTDTAAAAEMQEAKRKLLVSFRQRRLA